MAVNLGGRPTKRDAATVATIKRALASGFSNADAAKAAKIGLSTLQEWMLIPEFRQEIESEIILRRMDRMEKIERGVPHWQALGWMQERTAIFEGDIRWISPDLQIRCRLFEAGQTPQAPQAVVDQDAKARLDAEMRARFKLPPKEAA